MKSVVLITGASKGLGRHLAKKFEDEGHLVYRHMGKKHFDLRKRSEIIALSQEAKSNGVTTLINNAAITCPGISFREYETNEIDEMIKVNLLAPILLVLELEN